MHRAVGQVDLRLNPGDRTDLEPRRCPERITGQRGLPDPGTAAEHQHPAQLTPDGIQQLIDSGPLRAPVQQRALRTPPSLLHDGHPLTPNNPMLGALQTSARAQAPDERSARQSAPFDRSPPLTRPALVPRRNWAARRAGGSETGAHDPGLGVATALGWGS